MLTDKKKPLATAVQEFENNANLESHAHIHAPTYTHTDRGFACLFFYNQKNLTISHVQLCHFFSADLIVHLLDDVGHKGPISICGKSASPHNDHRQYWSSDMSVKQYCSGVIKC